MLQKLRKWVKVCVKRHDDGVLPECESKKLLVVDSRHSDLAGISIRDIRALRRVRFGGAILKVRRREH